MHIIFFTHPNFIAHQSMPRYANWLAEGMKRRGHTTAFRTAKAVFYNWPVPAFFKKWLSYIDQYIVFPRSIKQQIKTANPDTLFVFTDHALGPWVPLAAGKKHVIHCHDFLAQRSALGQIPENPTGWTGKQYQSYIRSGYRKGKNFISVSKKTQADLHEFLGFMPRLSEVVYNGVNPVYKPGNAAEARKDLSSFLNIALHNGYLLHVGGNQWYKNRTGVLEVYNVWRKTSNHTLPLLMVGSEPDNVMLEIQQQSGYKQDIHFITGLNDDNLVKVYQGASLFLFPSLAEGFGWPIAEAMAAGTAVLTTNEAPMTEVAGDSATLVDRKPHDENLHASWAAQVADAINARLNETGEQQASAIAAGLENIKRFDSEKGLDLIEQLYQKIVAE